MLYTRIKNNSYRDSISLTLLTDAVKKNAAVNNAQVVMGTDANKELLKELHLYNEEVKAAKPNDMIIAIEADQAGVIDTVMQEVEDFLSYETSERKTVRREKTSNRAEAKSQFIDALLPLERQIGKVHSVFNTSFNIMINDQLINFSRVGMPLNPHGCLLQQEKMNELLEKIRPGNIVRVKEEKFTFYTTEKIMSVDLSNMQAINLSIPKIEIPIEQISKTNLYKVLEAVPFTKRIGLENTKDTAAAFEILETINKQTKEKQKQAFTYLIGRGNGLTPSGDDILIGFVMLRKAFSQSAIFEEMLKEAEEQRNTTDISKAYYQSVFNGYISSIFSSFLENIYETDSKNKNETEVLIRQIGKYGHTSGYDTMFGIFLGLKSFL